MMIDNAVLCQIDDILRDLIDRGNVREAAAAGQERSLCRMPGLSPHSRACDGRRV